MAPEPIDWGRTTFEGNRVRQHQAFRALSFREKLARLEQMSEVARCFAAKNGANGATNRDGVTPASRADSDASAQGKTPGAEHA